MAQVNDVKNKTCEACQIVLSFLGVLLKDTGKKELKWLSKLGEVDDSEQLQDVVFLSLMHEQFRESGYHIKDEESSQVVVTDS